MTETQYESMMFAFSSIIALLKKQNPILPVPGIKYDVVLQQEKEKLAEEAEAIFKDLTGSKYSRETQKTDWHEITMRELAEQQKKEDQIRVKYEAEEKARIEKLKQEEQARQEEINKVSMPHVACTDYLQGDNNENN